MPIRYDFYSNKVEWFTTSRRLRPHTLNLSLKHMNKLEGLKALMRSADILDNRKISQGQLRLIIET